VEKNCNAVATRRPVTRDSLSCKKKHLLPLP